MKHVLNTAFRLAAAIIALPLLSPNVSALQITATSSPDVTIADGDENGLLSIINVTTPITSIQSLTVTLDIEGGYNGDFYAYLRHSDSGGTGFSVLLNRVGVSSLDAFGAADTGFDVTFDDNAALDVHLANASGGTLTGSYRPDGRLLDPFSNAALFDAISPSALLSAFGGMDPNGKWELFVADVSSGSIGTLKSWGLTINGTEATGVPDVGGTVLMLLAASGFVFLFHWRQKAQQARPPR